MTAAAAPVMYGPNGMRIFLVAASAAIIAALLAAASTKGIPARPRRLSRRASGGTCLAPLRMASRIPSRSPAGRAGEREVEPACQHRSVPGLAHASGQGLVRRP